MGLLEPQRRPARRRRRLLRDAQNNVNNGHPTDTKGWAVGTGVVFNLPEGGKFGVNFQYAKGAAGYGSAGGSWFLLDPGKSVGIGVMADGIFDIGTDISLSTVWNAIAFYEFRWPGAPRWKTSFFGGYVDISYDGDAANHINRRFPGTAGTLVCGGVPVGGAVFAARFQYHPAAAGNSCSPDFSYWQAGTRTQWNPHPNLDIGVEVLYTRLNTAYKGALIAPKASIRGSRRTRSSRSRTRTCGRRSSAGSATSTHDRLIQTIMASTSRPPAGNRRGFLSSTGSPPSEASCRGRARPPGRRSWSVRYYICCEDRLTWRIPDRLHSDLAAGKLALPQFASSRQKILRRCLG